MSIRKMRCSFCRKTEDEISKLVAGPMLFYGPTLYICNECVAAAESIMRADSPSTRPVSPTSLCKIKRWWRSLLRFDEPLKTVVVDQL